MRRKKKSAMDSAAFSDVRNCKQSEDRKERASSVRSGSALSVSSMVRKLSHRTSMKKHSNVYNKGIFIPPHCKFRLVVQTVKPELTVCFMLSEMAGYALACNKTEEVYAEKVINDTKFWERCSFIPSVNLWHDGFCAFESVREASRYLLFIDGRFYFKKYDGTQQFKKDASFLFTKQIQVYPPRRSQSNIVPPDHTKLKLPTKSRKFSLNSFRSNSSHRNGDVDRSELQRMMPSGVLPFPDVVKKATNKTELFSLGFNNCYDCLTLTNFDHVQRIRENGGELTPTLSLNSSVYTFTDTVDTIYQASLVTENSSNNEEE